MRRFILLFVCLVVSFNCFGAKITLNIPNDKLDTVINALLYFKPVPQEANPEYDSETNSDVPETIPAYTDAEWAKEIIKDFIINQVLRYQRAVASSNAVKSIEADNTLLTTE